MIRLLPIGIACFIVLAVIGSGGLRVFWIVLIVIETVCLIALGWLQRLQLQRYRRALALPSSDR